MNVSIKRVSTFLWQLVETLPIIVPAVVAVFSCTVVALLVGPGLKDSLVWPLGIILSAVPVYIIWRTYSARSHDSSNNKNRLIDLLVLVGVAAWVVINMFFAAQDVFVTRDPGVYTVTGQWLTNHQTTDIKTPPIVEGQNGLVNHSSGIWLTTTPDKTTLQPQGMHLLPALLGLAGRIFGTQGVFKANIFFGGLALLSFYGFARQITRRGWAGLATLTMAVSLPMIYFSRHTYTEILALSLTFGALSVLWLAQHKPKSDKKLRLWLLSGFIAGAGTLTRPDAYLTVAALAVYLVIVLALARRPERTNWLKRAVSFLAAAAVPMIVAQMDLRRLTDSYYLSTKDDIKIQLILLAMVLIGGIVVIAVSWRTKILKFLDKRTENWRGYLAGLLILLGLLGLMLRPILLYSWHHLANNSGNLVGFTIRNQTTFNTSPKLVIDHTMDWISWYIGLPLLLLGFLGMAWAASKVMKDRYVKLLPALLVVGLTILMYGVLPRITLDQIWAIRRFLPVILPGLVVFGFYAVDNIFQLLNLGARLKRTGMVLAAAFIVLLPLSTSRPFLLVSEKAAGHETINALCQDFPKDAQVIWLGSVLELDAPQTTRAFCGNYTLGYNYRGRDGFKKDGRLDRTDLKNIADINKAAGIQTILAIRTNRAGGLSPLDRQFFTKAVSYSGVQMELPFYTAPQEAINIKDSFELARLDQAGNLVKF